MLRRIFGELVLENEQSSSRILPKYNDMQDKKAPSSKN